MPLTDPQAIANAVLHVDCRSHFQEPPQQAPVEAATPEVEMQPPAQGEFWVSKVTGDVQQP